jgi:peptidoglycan/LPS O-acetylase OafA/YrhL
MGDATGRSHNDGLDMLRALCAVAVFLFHFRLLDVGWLGVEVFFVISGFLITQSIESRPDGTRRDRMLGFYGRRIRRILPPLYIYLLVVAPLVFLRLPNLIDSWAAATTFTYNFYHLSAGWVHSRFFTHLWSLGVEEQFYIFFPFLMVLWRRHATPVLLAVVLVEPAIRFEFAELAAGSSAFVHSPVAAPAQQGGSLAVYVAGFTQLDAFALGALLRLYFHRVARFCTVPAIAALIALMIGLGWLTSGSRDGALYARFMGTPGAYQYVWGYTLVAVLAAMLIARFSRVLTPGVLSGLGLLGFYSYEFYILHYPVREIYLRFFPGDATRLDIVSAVVCFPIVVFLAVVLHHLGQAISRRLERPRVGARAGLP